jgi:hypothetical protein
MQSTLTRWTIAFLKSMSSKFELFSSGPELLECVSMGDWNWSRGPACAFHVLHKCSDWRNWILYWRRSGKFGQLWASTGIRHELFQSAHNSAQWFRPVPVSHGNALLLMRSRWTTAVLGQGILKRLDCRDDN